MNGSAQQQSGGDNSLDFLWTIVLVVGLVLLAWYFGRSYIAAAVFYVKNLEITAISFVAAFWNKIAAVLHLPLASLQSLIKWTNYTQAPAESSSQFNTLVAVSTDVGKYMRYPFILLLLIMAVVLYSHSIALKFKNIFSMDSLKKLEKPNWPRIMPVANLHLVDTKLDDGKWAMSVTPMQFCKQSKILKEEIKDGKPAVTLLRGDAHRVLALQLGPLANGHLDRLPLHVQALLAVFASRADGDIDSADNLLDQIAASANFSDKGSNGNLNFSGATSLLAKHANSKAAVKIMQRHAYVLTMMASMIELARTAGVMATADFIWLKPIDRKLWYTLNSIGRQTVVPEVAGIFSHWLAEKKLGFPMRVPMVDAAIEGLEKALKEILYEPDEE